MKKLKSLLPFLLMLFALVGCKTDDLEKDIDSLKDRVTSLEAQVSLLNDNLNAIRVILDGSKTISSYTSENGTYTLTLSDGSTIALTQGSEGQIVMPDITINENGQWVLNGEVIGQATGNSGITPKFNISADKYWQVSFDEGKTYEYVLDENGEKVAATTSGNVSVSDAFFEDVKVENDMLVVTLNGGETYSLPIVANLKANIVDPAEGFKNGVWTIGYGETVTTEVEISGDNYFVTVPAGGWTATLSEVKEGKATLTVTAPAQASTLSRATADNSTELVLQVNKGINWAIDKIKVEAKTVIASYKALYDVGQTLNIGGLEISKEKYGEATIVNTEDFDFKTNGVYFIEPGISVNWQSATNFDKLILIGNNSSEKSVLAPTKQIELSDADSGDGMLLCANLKIDATKVTNNDGGSTYLLAQNGNTAYKYAKFYNCDITTPASQPLTYISTSTRSFETLSFENCIFDYSGTGQQYLISLGSSTATYGTLIFKNNVFYNKEASSLIPKFKLFNGTKATINKLELEHNTFVNMACETTFFVYVSKLTDIVAQYNLFYTDVDLPNACGVFRVIDTPATGSVCDNNIVYRNDAYNWQMFYGGIKNGFEGAVEVERVEENPFTGGTFDLSIGTFVPNATYAEYGAKFE